MFVCGFLGVYINTWLNYVLCSLLVLYSMYVIFFISIISHLLLLCMVSYSVAS